MGPGDSGTSQLTSRPVPALATRPWLALGEGGSCGFCESVASGHGRGPQFSLRPRCLQLARGWGPGGSEPRPGRSRRTANGTGTGGSELRRLLRPGRPTPASTSAPTFLGGGVPGTALGSASFSSSELGPQLQGGWRPGEREMEGSVREPSLATVVSMAIM